MKKEKNTKNTPNFSGRYPRPNDLLHSVWQVFHGSCSMNAGFAMLFAVLISSLVLSIGISIFNLTIKELNLSSSGRESQFSFYAADSGVECALYWDSKEAFATSSGYLTPNVPNRKCGNNFNINNTGSPSGSDVNTEFSFDTVMNLSPALTSCAKVTVTKKNVSGFIETTIISRGYNEATANANDCSFPGSKTLLVERALRVRY